MMTPAHLIGEAIHGQATGFAVRHATPKELTNQEPQHLTFASHAGQRRVLGGGASRTDVAVDGGLGAGVLESQQSTPGVHVVTGLITIGGLSFKKCSCGVVSMPSVYPEDLARWQCYYAEADAFASSAMRLFLKAEADASMDGRRR